MELAAELADLHEKSYCAICMEYFKNTPCHTMGCGHKVCLSCISVFWKDLKDCFPCPSCRLSHPGRNSLSNQPPDESTAAELPPQKTSRGERQEEEGELPCRTPHQTVSCSLHSFTLSRPHHVVWPVEIATLYRRKKIDCYIKLWREMVEPVHNAIATQRRRSLELRKRAEHRREEMKSQYEQHRQFLQDEREKILEQLQSEEMDGLAKLNENLAQLSDHASSLKNLLKELKSLCVKSNLALLASVKDWYVRYNHSRRPEIASVGFEKFDFRLPLQYSDLDRIIKRFQVDVILNPETANHRLIISNDKKTVQYGTRDLVPYSARRFLFDPAVLGSQGYSSDRQYWEVDVGHKSEWILGVCTELFFRSKNDVHEPFSAQDGFWGVGLDILKTFIALGHKRINLLPKVAPNRIGIFLDSEVHEVSFYNLSDKSLLYRFSDCPRGTFWPYFYTGYDFRPLKICTVADPE